MLNNFSECSHYVIDANRFSFRNVVRILALVFLFLNNLNLKANIHSHLTAIPMKELPVQFKNSINKYLITEVKNAINAFPFDCRKARKEAP